MSEHTEAATLCSSCGKPTGTVVPLTPLYKAAKATPGNPGSVPFSGRDEKGRPLVPDPRGARCPRCQGELEGRRVELVASGDPYTALTAGARGTVESIDATGTLHVTWDTGARLGLLPERDAWRTLPEASTNG